MNTTIYGLPRLWTNLYKTQLELLSKIKAADVSCTSAAQIYEYYFYY